MTAHHEKKDEHRIRDRGVKAERRSGESSESLFESRR